MKGVYGKFNGKVIYKLDHLMNAELSDNDLTLLLDGPSLNLSLVVAEYLHMGDTRKYDSILNSCKANSEWFDKKSWNKTQQDVFRNILAKVYKNIYYYSEQRCLDMADMWLLNFGFKCIHE